MFSATGLCDPRLLNVEQDLEADEKRHSHFPWPPLPFLQPADWLSFGKQATKGYSRMAQASRVVAEECQKDGGYILCAGMDESVVSFGHTFDGSPVILSFCCEREAAQKEEMVRFGGNGTLQLASSVNTLSSFQSLLRMSSFITVSGTLFYLFSLHLSVRGLSIRAYSKALTARRTAGKVIEGSLGYFCWMKVSAAAFSVELSARQFSRC